MSTGVIRGTDMLKRLTEVPRIRGNLIVISGPSGSGKNSALAAVRSKVPDLVYSISATTRRPREDEIDGVHYFFLTREEFLAMKDAGAFLETAEFCGNLYGTPRSFVEGKLDAGEDVIMDIEIRGADQVRAKMPDAVTIFLMPPSLAELEARLAKRGADSPEATRRRLRKAIEEIPAVLKYDYVVLNYDLEQAAEQIRSIIVAERARVGRCDCEHFIRGFEMESQIF
ncbi:MAG TPA: guanylate kinase [Bacillota bacterium]|jgi:guanylate kinase|nr:guanylate kinase [Bacillota bacterium]